jgi:transcriptional regulator with PAS, ATPase and Fis domain
MQMFSGVDYLPFVAVNCTALPDHLVESEMFGHTKGAFTDAKSDKKGLFELANGGTILLDEIGDMPTNLQSKLLRVLEDRKVRRIGGKVDLAVDVTVIATTNKNLDEAVEAGFFRTDLYYRLNTFALHMPPLRERKDDIPVLTRFFFKSLTQNYLKVTSDDVSPEAEQILCAYDWPGPSFQLMHVLLNPLSLILIQDGVSVITGIA